MSSTRLRVSMYGLNLIHKRANALFWVIPVITMGRQPHAPGLQGVDMFRRTVLAATAAMTVAAGLPAVAHAKDAWPVKTITLVQPYAPGGTSDMLARIVALELEKRIQASVIVESKPGANGNIATAYVSRAKPDGGTFLVGSSSPVVISPSLYKSVPYNPRTDLTPITPIAKAPFLLVTGATSGINSVDELVAQIKQDKLNFGSAGALGFCFSAGGGTRYFSGTSDSFSPSAGHDSFTERPLKNTRRASCDSFFRLAKLTKPPMADSASPGPDSASTFLVRLNAATMPQ